MSRFLLAAAFVLLAPAAVEAPASGKARDSDARTIMKRFAACTVQRRPDLARRFVLNPGERLPSSDFQRLVSPECLWRTASDVAWLRMRSLLYRGALAEELIRVEMPNGAVIAPAAVPELDWPDPLPPSSVDEKGRALTRAARKRSETVYAAAVADNYVARLGECVVRADPARSKAVVLTELDTPEELAEMKALSGTIASCVARGQTLKFNRTTLRAALAFSYYRLGGANRAERERGGEAAPMMEAAE